MPSALALKHPYSNISAASRLVHDLRQPLSTIEACVFCLRNALPQDEETEEYLERIEEQVFIASGILTEASRQGVLRAEAAERTNSTTSSLA